MTSAIPELLYKPSPFQSEYHALTQHEALGGGAAGPGKSLCLLMDPIYQVLVEHERFANPDHPHPIRRGESKGAALHLRRTFPMLRETIKRALLYFPKIDPGAHWNAKDCIWTFSSGYQLIFGHCRNPDDYGMYQSAEFTHIGFDELTQFTEDQYENICTRLRTTDHVLGGMLKIRSMSNPQMMSKNLDGDDFVVDNPFWVRDYFVTPAIEGGVELTRKIRLSNGTTVERKRIYLRALLKENPDEGFKLRYEAELASKKPHIRKALQDGDWFVQVESFYGEEWNSNIHIVAADKIPEHWPQFRSMDWGFKKPGCIHWFAMDDDDNLVCHREFTFKGKSAAEVAEEIKRIELELGLWDKRRDRSLVTGPADTQLWEERGDEKKGESKAKTMARLGVQWVPANKKSRKANAQRVYARLADHHHGTTKPGLVFYPNCKNAIRTIPAIRSDPNDSESPLDGGEDHWHDSVGYGVAYASRGRHVIPTRTPSRSKEDRDDDDLDGGPRTRGSHGYGGF